MPDKSQPSNSATPPDSAVHQGEFEPVIARNINMLIQQRERERKNLSGEEKVADSITRFAGSMKFVYLHVVVFSIWIAWNKLPLPVPKFDSELIILAMWASVEAIFISTFILISQNRQTKEADRRADLDLQVNLLTEHELSRLINLVMEMANQMGIDTDKDADLAAARRDVHPEQVMEQIESCKGSLEDTKPSL